MKRIFALAMGGVFAILLLFACLFPVRERIMAQREGVYCVYEDGSGEFLSGTDAIGLMKEAGRSVTIEKNGRTGRIELGEEAQNLIDTMEHGSLLNLLTLDTVGLSVFEKRAVDFYCADKLWYDGGAFAWTGKRFARVENKLAEEVVLIRGALPKGVLQDCGATLLTLRREADFTAEALVGSDISSVNAEKPYLFRDDGVYREEESGTRFVAGLPHATCLKIDGCSFLDENCLVACREPEELSLPFAGNTCFTQSDGYWSDMGRLFDDDLPKSLYRVAVRSGEVSQTFLYAFRGVKELDLCGVRAVSEGALSVMTALSYLRCPFDLSDKLDFSETYRSECGCFVYLF